MSEESESSSHIPVFTGKFLTVILAYYFDAHRTGCSFDHLHGRLNVVRIEIGHFKGSDLLDLLLCYLSDFILVGDCLILFLAGCLLNKNACRGVLRMKEKLRSA